MNSFLLWQPSGFSFAGEQLIRVLLALLILAAVCGLHWLTGRFRQRALQRLNLEQEEAGFDDAASIRRLMIDWTAKALRTAAWLFFFVSVLKLLPQEEDRFLSVRDQLLARLEQAGESLASNGIPVLLIVVITIFLMRFTSAIIKTVFDLFEQRIVSDNIAAVRRRSKTLSAISSGVAQSVLFFIGAMVLLQQLNVNITPILASAGIVGIAVGFGAQSLVKDIFAGFLILLEDQYGVGDSIKIGETAGTVEHLTLRATRIRALDGSLTTIPNGSIVSVANQSRDWSRAVLDVEMDYSQDADRAMQLMFETAQQLQQERPGEIIEEPIVQGMEKVTSGSYALRLIVKTAPAKQGDIARELRRRLKTAFDQAGIQMPSGQQQLVLMSAPGNQNLSTSSQDKSSS